MAASTGRSWFRTACLVAIGYALIGLLTVALNRAAGAAGLAFATRMVRAASWLLSAALFLIHIVSESRTAQPLPRAAWHTSAAVAMATLALAAVATVRQLHAGNARPAVFVAVGVWPLLTGLVSFAVGLALFAVLRRAAPTPPVS